MEAILSQFLALALTLAGAAPRQPLPAVAAWSALTAAPEAHLAEPVRLFLQFHSVEEDWECYQTRFSPEGWIALRAWTDEQRLWDPAEFERPEALVFVPRGGRLARLVPRLRPHDRIALVGVVRTAQLGRPWVEVRGCQRARSTVPEGTVLHAVKALELMDRKAWELAAEQLGRALAAPLPAPAAEELRGFVARCEAELEALRVRGASFRR